MAVKTLQKFNRIINLTFYTALGIPRAVKCPVKGRKPNIEINGNFTSKCELAAFNVTIKNFYIDLTSEQYTRLQVEAGYEGNTITFEGTILSMYPEAPGPEGSWVIQCQNGRMRNYLDATVQLDFAQGTPLRLVLAEISKKLGTYTVHAGEKAGALNLETRLQFDGTARNAMARLEQLFINYNLSVFVRENMLCAICMDTGDHINIHTLQYMSGLPQPQAGGSEGTYYTTITAPWEPKLQRGDLLRIPTRLYVRNFTLVSTKNSTQIIQINTLSFHFGTTGGANSMTVQGFLKGEPNGE